MKIARIMSRPVVWIAPDATIQAASQLMLKHSVGDLPVMAKGRVIGMLTETDIVTRAVAPGLDPAKALVKGLMTKGVEWCFEDEDIHAIVERMEKTGLHHMIVFDQDKKLIGFVTLSDIVIKGNDDLAKEAVQLILEARKSRREKKSECPKEGEGEGE